MGVIVTVRQDVLCGYDWLSPPRCFDGKNLTSIFVKFSAEPDFITVPSLSIMKLCGTLSPTNNENSKSQVSVTASKIN